MNLMIAAIGGGRTLGGAIAAAQRSARRAELKASAAETLDGDLALASYYRDYAKAMRLAVRSFSGRTTLQGLRSPTGRHRSLPAR